MLFYNFRTYSFSKPASQPTHPFLSLFQGLQLIQFHLSTNRVASCRRCIPNRAHNHCLFIYRLRASILPILSVNTPVSLPAYRPASLPANAPDVFCLGIPNPAHGLTPQPGVTGHAWNAVFLPIFAAYRSPSGGLNFGRDGPVTHKFFSFWDLEHFPGQPTCRRTCFPII